MEVLGEQAERHFRPLGGFSARRSPGEILTVLPHTSVHEAGQLMESYWRELMEQARTAVENGGLNPTAGRRFEVRIKGGASEVSFKDDIDQIAGKTASAQRVLAAYRYDEASPEES